MIQVKALHKTYQSGKVSTHVLKGISLDIANKEFVAIMGRSGAGKSTLMYQMSLLDEPTSGSIHINNLDTKKLSNKERTAFRLRELGYIFQDYALVPELSAAENVMIPLIMSGMKKNSAFKIAKETLERVGLNRQIHNLPGQLSGGEQQRVSVARAVAHHPKILFADEPTANLDNTSARSVIEILRQLHREGQTIVMVTHEEEYGKEADRIIRLEDGKIIGQEVI